MTNKTKRIVTNIAFYVALVLIYGFVIFGILTKINGGAVTIGGERMDVVLTDSMSSRNEHHLDFLEGTTQIQPNDIILSSTIDEKTEINVKDVVMFKNPDLGNRTVVHRVINIYEEGIPFKITNTRKDMFDGKEVTYLDRMTGNITVNALDLKSIEIIAYSKEEHSLYYQLFFGPNEMELHRVTTKEKEGVYKHVLTYSRTQKVPYRVVIKPAILEEEYIASIKYVSFAKGELVYDSSELVVDENNSYSKHFAPYYLYETRGDKGTTADGMFRREDLIARVHNTIPKLGIVVRFIQSIPGLVTFVGLGLIISLASFFWTKNEKKKALAENGSIEEVPPKEEVEKPTEEIEDKIDKKDEDV